jgi:hypothetical protein
MNSHFKELNTLTDKYSKSLYTFIHKNHHLIKQIVLYDIQNFNIELKRYIECEDPCQINFIGSNLNVLKTHLKNKLPNLSEIKKEKYLTFLKDNLHKEGFNFEKALNSKYFLKKPDFYYFVRGLSQKNERLIKNNAKLKYEHLKELIALSGFKTESKNEIVNKPKAEINLSHWNDNCFALFNYLYDNYFSGEKRQLTNIWYFLKNHLNEDKYYFKMTKSNYKEYIKLNYNIILTNFDKSVYKFDDEIRSLNEMRNHFEMA